MKKDELTQHLCAGGVIYQKGRVVLLLDRYNRLVLPKGHIESEENAKLAAEREIAEETGYRELRFIKSLNIEKFSYKVRGKTHKKIVFNFLFELAFDQKPTPKLEPQEIYKIKWLQIEEAIKKVHFQNTKRLLEIVKKYYDKIETDK